MKRIGVVGAGMMGTEIALCFAMSDCDVVLLEKDLSLAQKGKERMGALLEKLVKKKVFKPEDVPSTISRVTPSDQYGTLKDMDLVMEAVFEDLETKKELFDTLDDICKPDCIFATNTSSVSITLLATSVKGARRGRFIGAHFFSPASIMKLVEVIPGIETQEETIRTMIKCCTEIGKTPIRVKDVPGFVVNRLLHAMWIEANRLLEEEVALPEDIDIACKLGLGHPIGPYALMDLTSNDLNLKVQEILHEAYGERFRPRPILKQKVNANHLGRKSGLGWFQY